MHWIFHGMLAYLDWKLDSTLNSMVVKMMFGLARLSTGTLIYLFLSSFYVLFFYINVIFLNSCIRPSFGIL